MTWTKHTTWIWPSDEDGFYILPVNPEVIPSSEGVSHHSYQILNHREIGYLGNRRLREMTLRGLFPKDDADFVEGTHESPRTWLYRVRGWMRDKTPLRLIVQQSAMSGNYVVIDLDWEHRPGEPYDIYYTLALKEHIRTSSKVVATGPYPPQPKPAGIGAPRASTRYTIVSGDTLWGIAKRHYGNGALWPRIWDANKPMTSGNPNLIYPGETITIP